MSRCTYKTELNTQTITSAVEQICIYQPPLPSFPRGQQHNTLRACKHTYARAHTHVHIYTHTHTLCHSKSMREKIHPEPTCLHHAVQDIG